MAFPASVPADGTVHRENEQDFIAFNGYWYKRRAVEVVVDGGPDLGSAGTSTFAGINNVSTARLFRVRDAKHYIKFQGSYSPAKANSNFGLSFYVNNNWQDFSAKNVNFNQAEGFTNWGHGGVQIKDWYNMAHFDTTLWLADPQDRGRLPAKGKPCYFTIHMLQTHGTQFLLVWELKHQGSTNEAMTTTGSMLIGGSISNIDYLNVGVDAGSNFAGGRMTVEWW